MDFLSELESAVVLGDGAMGTELFASGVARSSCLEELCVSDSGRVLAIHAAYLQKGARLIRTNSFGANALRLAAHGLEKRVSEFNWTAAQLAREAAKPTDADVAGSVGPLGAESPRRHDLFLEQIGALLDGGIRVIMLESFTDLDEIAAALEAKHTLHHCPVIASIALREDATLPDGTSLAEGWQRLRDAGADVVGVNCAAINPTIAAAISEAAAQFSPVAIFPSAGLPRELDGRLEYPVSPSEFASASVALVQRGVRLIGGCCGAGPAHLDALRLALGTAGLISCS